MTDLPETSPAPETCKTSPTSRSQLGTLPKFEAHEDGKAIIQLTSEDALERLYGGSTPELATALTLQCLNISGYIKGWENDGGTAIAIVDAVSPRDGVEAMLANQMAATHIAMMRHSRLMASATEMPKLDLHEKIVNKLARTFTTQMEALRKNRNGGKQIVTVQHVNVEDGGQAIVGNVRTGEGQP